MGVFPHYQQCSHPTDGILDKTRLMRWNGKANRRTLKPSYTQAAALNLIDKNIITAMKAAGIPAEQILSVVEDALRREEEIKAGRREVDRVRKRRERATEKQARTTVASEASDGQTRTATDGADTVSPKEIPPTPPKEITPSDIPPATPKGVSAPKPTPRSELLAVLSQVQADAVVAHRQRIGKPMTPHAAHLLAAKFAKCPNPDEAADAMVANGWQGFEPHWMDRQSARAGPAPPKRRPVEDVIVNLLNRMGPANAEPASEIEGHPEAPRRLSAGQLG